MPRVLRRSQHCRTASTVRPVGSWAGKRKVQGFYQSWSAEGFSGFDECPKISPTALAEAQEAFRCRESVRRQRMAPIVTRLSEALARNGRFAAGDRVQDVAMALERMYVLDEGNIGRKLRNRTARLLGTDAASEKRIGENVKELYDVRSDIVHNRLHRLTPEKSSLGVRPGLRHRAAVAVQTAA